MTREGLNFVLQSSTSTALSVVLTQYCKIKKNQTYYSTSYHCTLCKGTFTYIHHTTQRWYKYRVELANSYLNGQDFSTFPREFQSFIGVLAFAGLYGRGVGVSNGYGGAGVGAGLGGGAGLYGRGVGVSNGYAGAGVAVTAGVGADAGVGGAANGGVSGTTGAGVGGGVNGAANGGVSGTAGIGAKASRGVTTTGTGTANTGVTAQKGYRKLRSE
ncbi:hypothetical protein PI124_g7265 [Phytophthora idaei]|nr:hypothetical protein PI124_g7265 [Phytophthora idaei]